MADIELDPNPESTWGATEEYKAAWNAQYGNEESAPSVPNGVVAEEEAKAAGVAPGTLGGTQAPKGSTVFGS